MAKILNKDPVTYQREHDGFIRDLQHFHETRGTPFRKTPKINGHEIDLYLLYVLVTAHGGWVKVNSRNEWESLVDHFHLPKHCVNCGVALKQIYLRFLDRYEKVHYLGEDVDRGSDDDEESRHRRWSARALHSVPLTYNHHQHNVAENLRTYNGLSADLYKPTDYDRLALSLMSPLPNEQDFAINVCTLLSNEGKHTLKLDKYPRLIDFLLAHTGVFNHTSTRQLYEEVYGNIRRHSLRHFWSDTLLDLDLNELTDEKLFPTKKPKVKEVICDSGGKAGMAGANCKDDAGTVASGTVAAGTVAAGTVAASSSKCSDKILVKTDGEGEGVEKMEVDLVAVAPEKTEEPKGMVDCATSMEVDVNTSVDPSATDSTERTDVVCERIFEEGEDGLLCEVDSKEEPTKTESRLKVPLKVENSDFELFCLGRTFGTQDYIGQRVLQVATILRNLSFGEENLNTLAHSVPFLRFLLLCVGSRWNCLHQLGLDMLGNVASEVLLEDPTTDRLAASLLNSMTRGLHSQDRLVVLSCLEVLNKLSQKDENEDIMLRYLDQHVYNQVCTFLTLHDIMLLIYTLECLYSLSSLGERACNCIVRVHGAIDTLVSLITVEAQSYGPKACILMRVVETVSGGTQANSTPSTTTTTTSTAMANTSSPAPVIATPARPQIVAPSRQSTAQRMVIGAPQPAVATPVTLTMTQTPQSYQQQQHAHQQAAQENEQFALAWLRATFEPTTGCRIEQGELYKQYLTACAKIGRRGVIAPLHFPRCVRSVFGGTVGPNPQKQAGVAGSAEQQGTSNLMYYEGIKVRASPFSIPVSATVTVQQPPTPQTAQTVPVQQHKGLNVVTKTITPPPSSSPAPDNAGDAAVPLAPAPASPILKAQLSAPPKPRETPKGDAKSQVLAHPHLTQALLGSSGGGTSSNPTPASCNNKEATTTVGGPPTSLIKSLLATKVNAGGSECMMPQSTATSMMPAACSTTTTTASTSTKQPPPTSQVTQRQQQQRLLQQQLSKDTSPPPVLQTAATNNVQGKAVVTVVPAKNNPAVTSTTAPAPVSVVVTTTAVVKTPDPRQRTSRINGARTPLQQNTPLQNQAQAQTQTQMETAKEGDSSTGVTVITSTASVITSTGQCGSGTSVISQVPSRTVMENHIPATGLGVGGVNVAIRGRREPPQPPPPPLAPLSNNSRLPPRLDVEDSDSTGNNSLASSSRDCSGTGAGNISSTDDGENSLTSFEGLLLNGIPHSLDIDAASNDSSSKDSARSSTQQNAKPLNTKSLMLADLLEKKVDKKEPPIINGVLGKELRIGEKGLELVENHLEKVLKESSVSQLKTGDSKEPCIEASGVVRTVGQVTNNSTGEKSNTGFKTVGCGTTDDPVVSNSVMTSTEQVKFGVVTQQTQTVQGVKRPASDNLGIEDGLLDAKRQHLSSESAVNGTASPGPLTVCEEQNPPPPSSPELAEKSPDSNASGDNNEVVNASPSAANLYAALAASALEDEPDLDLPPPPPPTQVLVQSAGGLRQAMFLGQGVDSAAQQQLIVTAAPRQIIVSQGQLAPQGQVLITAGGQITLQQGPNAATATIKTPSGHQAVPVLVQTSGGGAQRTVAQSAQLMQTGQVVLSQSSSGQFILSQAPAQGQVQLVQTSSGQSQYIVSAGGSSGQAHYVVAQPQTALVQGQTQTVLVAQTPQQQGTGTKTIIILQPQSSPAATHHQKVVVTPQGQPVVVTQVPRPILQSPAISNPQSSIHPPALVPTSNAPVCTSPQPVKHIGTATTALPSNTNPVLMASRGTQPSLIASTGTSTSLPPSHSQPRAITPTNSLTSVAPASPSTITATKTSAKPPNVQPAATPTMPRPSMSPTLSTINSPRTITPIQQQQPKPLPRAMPPSRPSPISSPSPAGSSGSNSSQSTSNPKVPSQPVRPPGTDSIFLCEWRGCMRSFKSANEVYMHACESHCPQGSEEIQCLWERCDAMKRKRFSLMTHLFDRHCNADVLRMMAVRRRQLSQSGRSEIPPPQPPPPHPGYAPNAAFHAIKRHALEFVNPKEMMRPAKPGPPVTIPARTGPSPPEQDDNEGPVTKSIRLTSSLILRNLVIYSTNGRRFLRSYEPHLASVALSNVESSRTIAQVLYDMNQQTSQR